MGRWGELEFDIWVKQFLVNNIYLPYD